MRLPPFFPAYDPTQQRDAGIDQEHARVFDAGELEDGGSKVFDQHEIVGDFGFDIENFELGDLEDLDLEFETFRMRGHEEASGTDYVPKVLLEEWARAAVKLGPEGEAQARAAYRATAPYRAGVHSNFYVAPPQVIVRPPAIAYP